MVQLSFYGPFHFDEIINGRLIQMDKPGIYIWGFMYKYDYANKKGIKPINYKEKGIAYRADDVQFIPYYVGEMTSKISDRIKKHHNIRASDAHKYIRLSHDYMLKFFKDRTFPTNDGSSARLKKEIDNIIQRNLQEIQYYNDDASLKMIYGSNFQPQGEKYDWPITNQKLNDNFIPDTLYDLTYHMNNFWFCYAVFNPVNKSEVASKTTLMPLETYTYWSLKGKTISKTGKFKKDPTITIIDHTNASIFDTDLEGKVSPSIDFNGY